MEGVFNDIHGRILSEVGYSNFFRGEPNGDRIENCVQVQYVPQMMRLEYKLYWLIVSFYAEHTVRV